MNTSLPPEPAPVRPRLTSSDIDRHFEARLRSLSPPAPVSVYLPAPRDDELQVRLAKLQAGSGGDSSSERAPDPGELERRLRRLQGEDVPDGASEPSPAPLTTETAAHMLAPAPVYGSAGSEMEELLRQVQDEVQLDYQSVYDTAVQLGRPLDGTQQRTANQRQRPAATSAGGVEQGVDAEDAERLMDELQRLPSTDIVKLKHAAGSRYVSDDEEDSDSDDEHG